MKKFGKKTIFRSLASACALGTSCCSAMVYGQQLVPKQSNDSGLPPIVSAKPISGDDGAPPIVSAKSISANDGLPPIVRAVQLPTVPALPPIVSATSVAGQQSAQGSASKPGANQTANTPPQTVPSTLRGTNFPTDGQTRIAEFVKANQINVGADSIKSAPTQIAGSGTSPSGIVGGNLLPIVTPDEARPAVVPLIQANTQIGGSGSRTPQLAPPQLGSGSRSVQSVPPTLQSGPGAIDVIQSTPGTNDFFQADPVTVDAANVGQPINYGNLNSTFDCCGFVRDSRNYLIVDALYWEREDGVFRASNILNLDDFDHSWGGRITWGTKRDSTRGVEFSYMQLDSLLAVSSQTDPGGSLIGGVFGNPVTGDLPASAFTAFRNGTFGEQFHSTELRSAEINQTWWGSDVAKLFIGARYINFEDEFRLSFANTLGEQGFHSLDATNNLAGIHIGGEVLYDIGYRLSFSFGGKLGGYLNFSDVDLSHINAGQISALASDNDTDFSWSGELGAWARYKISRNARLRIGYEVLGLFDVQESESAFNPIVQANVAPGFNDGDAVFHGPSVGFEVYR